MNGRVEVQAWQESNLQHTVLETVALPIGATGLYFMRSGLQRCLLLVQTRHASSLLLCFFMNNVFTAKRTKFLQLQTVRMLFFVLGTVVIDTVARGALKMNCLAHILFPTFFALPRLCLSAPAGRPAR